MCVRRIQDHKSVAFLRFKHKRIVVIGLVIHRNGVVQEPDRFHNTGLGLVIILNDSDAVKDARNRKSDDLIKKNQNNNDRQKEIDSAFITAFPVLLRQKKKKHEKAKGNCGVQDQINKEIYQISFLPLIDKPVLHYPSAWQAVSNESAKNVRNIPDGVIT